jgi:PAS domain S-box-containing protein
MDSLKALFTYATEGIIISNQAGLIVQANPSAEQMFGYEAGQLGGKTIEDLIPQQYKSAHEQHRHSYNAKPKARAMGKSLDLFGLRKNGSSFAVEVSLSYYQDAGDMQIIAFIMDISERKKHEDHIRKMNIGLEEKIHERTKVLKVALEELEQSREQLTHALAREKELNDMKSRFVTMASHEFRTPLSTILSSISLVNTYKGSDEKIQRHIQRIRSAVTNMTLILNDFLSVEKLEVGHVTPHNEIILWNTFIYDIKNEMSGLLKPGQYFKIEHTGDQKIQFDPQIMRNVLFNLISNAIKFSSDSTCISINTILHASMFKIEVCDKGMGIPEDEHKRLFDRFFRAKNAINIQGTGLGLHIVKKYIETMSGTISFKSSSKGTCFTILIPQ